MKLRGRWVALGLGLLAAAAGLWFQPWRVTEGGVSGGVSGGDRVWRAERIVPADTRIRVEVLNATGVRGIARRGTSVLRDLGFDVVGSGNAPSRLDSTTVLVRTDRMAWGLLAAKGLGGARIEARPDTSRYVDLTILLGADWRPPPEAFDP